MKNLRKLIAILAAVSVMGGLVSCGTANMSDQAGASSSVESAAASGSSVEEKPTAEPTTESTAEPTAEPEKGPVYRLTKKTHVPSSGIFTTVTEYDKNGNVTKESQCLIDGTLSSYIEYKYDQENRKISQVSRNVLQDTESTTTWEYDEAGNMIRQIATHSDGDRKITNRIEYSYENGKLMSSTSYRDEELNEILRYEYDTAGNQIKRTKYFCLAGMERADGYTAWEYDAAGNMIKETHFSSGVDNGYTLWEYDENGLLMKETVYNKGNELAYVKVMVYDEAGNCIGYNKDSANPKFADSEYRYDSTYDEAGNLIEVVAHERTTNLKELVGSDDSPEGKVLYTETYEYEKVTK